MKEFIEFLVKNVVKNPDSVAITELIEGTNLRYSIAVDQADMGFVIGKEGRTINSIRSLAKAKAVKEGVWVDVELVDKDRSMMNTESVAQNA
ncbi:MAG: KH domain-containing protein [Patescibacteria group bacterium]